MSFETEQFINLVKEDNLIGLKELWKSSSDKVNFCYNNEYTFILSCENGHLEVAKWLWENFEHKIDIHYYDEDTFRRSCKNGHLEVAKWLWEIS